MTDAAAPSAPARAPLTAAGLERSVRLWSGVVLMTFVTTHLLNHAVGVFGVAAMTEGQIWRTAVWRSWPGTVALYGALAAHMTLTLKRAVMRSTWRMPLMEASQLVLGLSIPLLALDHVIGTRMMAGQAGFQDSYLNLLRLLWPGLALTQTLMTLVVWTHGVIGIAFAARDKAWFRRWRTAFVIGSVLVPAMALAGFVSAGREAMGITEPPVQISEAHFAAFAAAKALFGPLTQGVVAGAVLLLAGRILLLWRRPMVTVRYSGHGKVESPRGMTLLEMSRQHHVPHPSSCGGRGRCGSCRVLVISGGADLAEPAGVERRMLDKLRAPQAVRLACQIRPQEDIAVRMLMPSADSGRRLMWSAEALDWGAERELTVLFADIRSFSSLARHQAPGDLVVLLNRMIDEIAQATELRGGRIAMVETDGVMAVFGLDGDARAGARAALKAAGDVLKAIEAANADLGLGVSQPVRVGIGLHTGPVLATEVGDSQRGFQLAAIGVTVVIASRLEEATKEAAADCVVSAATLAGAGLPPQTARTLQVNYKNGDAPIAAVAFADRADLERRLLRA